MQRFKITLTDGTAATVTRTIRDQVATETYFRAHPRLGAMSDNPFRSIAFVAWSAAKREGVIDQNVTFDQFLEGHDANVVSVVDVEILDNDADETPEVEGLGEDMPADPYA